MGAIGAVGMRMRALEDESQLGGLEFSNIYSSNIVLTS